MTLLRRFTAKLGYGCKLIRSSWAGACRGREEFLSRQPLDRVKSVHTELKCVASAAMMGALAGALGKMSKSLRKNMAYGGVPFVLGYAAELARSKRGMAASITQGALENVIAVRDEHWLETHPINYA